MKKLLSTTICLIALTSAGFAQGTVSPANIPTTPFHTNSVAIGGTIGNTSPALGGFYYEVITAPSMTVSADASLQDLLSAPWSDTMLLATNTALATGGRMAGPSGSAGIVANWPELVSQSFIVVGWSANEGTTWAQVSGKLAGATFSGGEWSGGGLIPGGFLGATTIQAAKPGLANGTGTFSLFGSVGGPQGTPVTTPTDLYIVAPEPATITLLGLAAGTLLISRRRE